MMGHPVYDQLWQAIQHLYGSYNLVETLRSTKSGRTSANNQNIDINLLAIGLGDLSLVGSHAGLTVCVQGRKSQSAV